MSSVMRFKLIEREKEDTPIKVGVIGAGSFASQTINQIQVIPGITVSIIADIRKEKAIRGFIRSGYQHSNIKYVNDVDTANHYIEKKAPIITDDSQVLIESEVDVILEATGIPEVGAKHAYTAIQNKKILLWLPLKPMLQLDLF